MIYLGMIGLWQLIALFLIFGLILPLAALIDVIKSDFRGNDKIMWVLLIIFLSVFGAILYFAIGKKQKLSR